MSSYSQNDGLDASPRRDRAAIAAQACQTCRNRKSKCDEQRPKCGLCTRLNVDCLYREPQPTKKDKTMVQILETVRRLEAKFDAFSGTTASNFKESLSQMFDPQDLAFQDDSTELVSPQTNNVSSVDSRSQMDGLDGHLRPSPPKGHYQTHQDQDGLDNQQQQQQQNHQQQQRHPGRHLTVAHKMLLWPRLYQYIVVAHRQAAQDLAAVEQDGTPWFVHLEMHKVSAALPAPTDHRSFLIPGQEMPDGVSDSHPFPDMTLESIQKLTESYFSTFNIIHPILDEDAFITQVMAPIIRDGYTDGDSSAVLALMVLALGQVGLDGVYGAPISQHNGVPSGIRGGTVDEPPGLALFNEARRRMGFVINQCNLQTVQIWLLQATYYESSARHLDFWRCSVAASMSCQVMIKCEQIDWTTYEGDLIKRAYWSCVISEDLYHLELDLPRTGIHTLEDSVPLPYFRDGPDGTTSTPPQKSHFHYHFLAMIALRNLITRIHAAIHGNATPAEEAGSPPIHMIKELAHQLELWRSLLPTSLQWTDESRHDFPDLSDSMDHRSQEQLFVLDQGRHPVSHQFSLDIATGQLRTRFYYARFTIYRPFLYKVLHHPAIITPQDAEYCALAVASACLWPLAMAPARNKKRLVPHLFTWTQNFIGILLMLFVATKEYTLRQICDEKVDREVMEQTAMLLLDWVQDIKQVDDIAAWAWKILEPLCTDSGVT